jgi:hypothetical protein
MEKDYKFVRFVEPIDASVLGSMSTQSLLKRLEELRALHECAEDSDWSEDETQSASEMITFKNTDIWKSAWFEAKEILATREHVPRGNKERRQQAARSKKYR